MKVGKYKGQSLREIMETTKGKYYINWFAENVVTPDNSKYYGKILTINQMLLNTKQIKPGTNDEDENSD